MAASFLFDGCSFFFLWLAIFFKMAGVSDGFFFWWTLTFSDGCLLSSTVASFKLLFPFFFQHQAIPLEWGALHEAILQIRDSNNKHRLQ